MMSILVLRKWVTLHISFMSLIFSFILSHMATDSCKGTWEYSPYLGSHTQVELRDSLAKQREDFFFPY